MAGTGTGYERDVDSFAREAGENIENRYRFVNLDNDGNVVVAGAGEYVIGTNYNSPDSGEDVDVRYLGVVKVESGGSLSAEDLVTPDANGKAVAAASATVDTTTSDASQAVDGDNVAGMLLEDLEDGEVGPCLLGYGAGLTG